MRRTTLALGLAGALLAGALTAAPAQADGPHDGPVSVDTTVPANGGYSNLGSQSLPKDTEVLKVKVKPQEGSTPPEEDSFRFLTAHMGTMSKRGRLLFCIQSYFNLSAAPDWQDQDTGKFEENEQDLNLLFVVACLEIAGLLNASATPAKDGVAWAPRDAAPTTALARAASPCPKASRQVPAQLTKAEDGSWTLTAKLKSKKAKNPRLKVGCRIKGDAVTYTVRPGKKGTTLRQVAGKRFRMSLQTPQGSSSAAPVTVTFDPV